MALHGLFKLCFGRLLEIRQYGIQRIQLVEIPMAADRRTGSAIARALPVVQALFGAGRQRRDVFRQAARRRRQIIKDPMYPRHFRG